MGDDRVEAMQAHWKPKTARFVLIYFLIASPLWTLGGLAAKVQQQEQTPPALISQTETATALIPQTEISEEQTITTVGVAASPSSPATATATTEPTATLTPQSEWASSNSMPGELLIRFRKNIPREAIEQCIHTLGASIISEIDEIRVIHISTPAHPSSAAINQLSACPGVRYAEPNFIAYATDTIPSDPAWGLQYGLVNIRAPQGWDLSTGSAVTLAIIDSGIDLNHADFAGKLLPGYDFVDNDSIPQDENGHGTHVAGIAGAVGNNGIGIAGVSWGALILPVKVLGPTGNGTFANVAAGIIWAVDHGAQVINLSLGGPNHSQVLQDAVLYASMRGVLLVAASGNSGSAAVLYPARYPEVIAVAAVDTANHRASFSNYGPEIDLAAPGVAIYSTSPGGYGYRTGTSMAAPFVAGLAAVLRGIPGNDSADAIVFEMKSTALDLELPGVDDLTGFGLIQMDAALYALQPSATQTLAAATIIFPTLPVSTSTFTQRPSPNGLPGPGPTGIYGPSTPPVSLTPSPSVAPSTTVLTPTAIQSKSETPEVVALELPASLSPASPKSWALPCVGTFLILLGFLLFWLARRSRRKYHGLRR